MEFTRDYTNVHGDENETHYTGYIQFKTDLDNNHRECQKMYLNNWGYV